MIDLPSRVRTVANQLQQAGGKCFLVGGYVRDLQLGVPSKDIDIEIHGLEPTQVEAVLRRHGDVNLVGQSFGVYLLKGIDVDWSLPRTEKSIGSRHKDFAVNIDPHLGIRKALQRRDFTMNAMAISMKDWNQIDPFGGQADILNGVLRHVDENTFKEDPLRVLRGMQFAARLNIRLSNETADLCQMMVEDYYSLPKERVWEELKKMLLKGVKPSLGLRLLETVGWSIHWPEIARLFITPQDPEYHPEGDVGTHTCQVIDVAAELRDDLLEEEKLPFMLACLLHDIGKPDTTHIPNQGDGGYITSHGHEAAGVPLARMFLERLTNEEDLIKQVLPLIGNHMFPHTCMPARAPAYRRLQKKVNPYLLGKVCEADGLKPKLKKRYYHMIKEVGLVAPEGSNKTVVQGKHLIARGLEPGPQFKKIITKCEEEFILTGERDPKKLLDKIIEK